MNAETVLIRKEQIDVCKLWIRENHFNKVKHVTNKCSAYRLKHMVECWTQGFLGEPMYISEQAFIIAAVELGYSSKAVGGYSHPSIYFNMGKNLKNGKKTKVKTK